MVMVITPQVVPQAEYGKYMAIVSSVFAISSILGPILGGVINGQSTWRWIFLLNAPGGAAATALLILFLPSSSTHHATTLKGRIGSLFTRHSLRRIDTVGVFLLLAASILLVLAFEEGGTHYPWDSAMIIATIPIACVCWIAFAAWEHFLDISKSVQEPVFPMRLLKSRIVVGMVL